MLQYLIKLKLGRHILKVHVLIQLCNKATFPDIWNSIALENSSYSLDSTKTIVKAKNWNMVQIIKKQKGYDKNLVSQAVQS